MILMKTKTEMERQSKLERQSKIERQCKLEVKPKSKKAIILLSGGLDSVANLYAAEADPTVDVTMALTFDYKQRASHKEILVARYHCSKLGIEHKVIRTSLLSRYSSSALTDRKQDLPLGDQEVNLQDYKRCEQTAQAVWVPNRNGIFLNLGAFFAETTQASWVLVGFNREEAQTFPDNSAAFLEAANNFFFYSTQNHVQVKSYTLAMTKQVMIEKLGHLFSLSQLWPCYQDQNSWCGQCESCKRFQSALQYQGYKWEDYVTQNALFIRSL
jgi:7-cyano-7-deazaguanine synthase